MFKEWTAADGRPVHDIPGADHTFALTRDDTYIGPLTEKSPEQVAFLLAEAIDYLGLRWMDAPPVPYDGLYGVVPLPNLPDAQFAFQGAVELIYAMARGKPRSMGAEWSKLNMRVRNAEEAAVDAYIAKQVSKASDKRERNTQRSLVYFIAGQSGPIKIGMAINPEQRRKELQTSHHERLEILATTKGGQKQERAYHARFAEHRLNGEWFSRHPDILAEIERLSIRRDRPAISEKLPGSSHQGSEA